MAHKTTTTTSPVTCGAYVTVHAADPAYVTRIAGRDATCKRLPMHHGDCRGTLKAAPKPRVTKASKRVTKAADVKALLAAIEDGSMTASEALSLLSAAKPRASRKPASKPASVTKSAKPVVWGCNVKAPNGVTGKVVRVTGDRAEIMLADKSRKTFVLASLTRI